MAKQQVILQALNRGEVSPQVLGRTDLEHLRLAAETQENWQPRVLGPGTARPGSEHLGSPHNGSQAKLVHFVAQFDDTAVIELTNYLMRFYVDDALVTRSSVSTVIPGFDTPGWSVTNQTGTTAVSVETSASPGLSFWNLSPGSYGTVDAQVSVASQDINVEHGVRIVVANGPINFSVGSTQGADDLFLTGLLDTGVFSFGFTPIGSSFWIRFASVIGPENFSTVRQNQPQGYQTVTVTSIAIEPGGVMTLPTPWPESVLVPPAAIRHDASADVTFFACPGFPQQVVTRFGVTSWSVMAYKPVKGPMNATPGDSAIQLSVTQLVGNTVLTASQPIFSQDTVGTLFRLYTWQQYVTTQIEFPNTWTDAIRVSGVSSVSEVTGGTITDISTPDRDFSVSISGTWTGTITLARSFDGYTTGFNSFMTFTSNTTQALSDNLNNEIVYYRLGNSGDSVTGTPLCTLGYVGGGGEGVCHVTNYISPTQVEVEILVPFTFNGTAYDWRQSEWSYNQGFPTSVGLHEGRLWWAGAQRWWGSSSDDYTNFDFDYGGGTGGDAMYIDELVGQGPIANINWLLSLDALIGGGDTQIIMARSDAIQSPLTPTNFNLRFSTNQGSAGVQAGKLDRTAIFINQSGRRVYKLEYDLYMYNMKATELSNLNPDIAGYVDPPGGYVAMAVQRNPDTIIHLVRADGQMVCLLYDPDDDVKAFWRKTTEGTYEDVIVMPGVIEDSVYVVVNRLNGRFIEKFARLDECWGDTICKLVDSHTIYQGTATDTISAPWLANQTVEVWADGVDMALVENQTTGQPNGPITLDGNGNGTLPTTAQNIIFGLPYTYNFLSAKLAYGAQFGSAVNEVKRVNAIGFVLWRTHCQALTFGPSLLNPVRNSPGDFSSDFSDDFSGAQNPFWDSTAPLDPMPQVEKAADVPVNLIWENYDNVKIEWPGDSDPDARISIIGKSPRPATIIAVTFSIESNG